MSMRVGEKTFWLTLVVFFAFALTVFRLAFIGKIPISPDEAYYWSWSQKPAIAYFDQPGMVAWINWIFNHLPNAPNEFTVRLPAVLLMFLTTLLSFFAYFELFGSAKQSAFFAISLNCVPIYFFSGLVMIHDTVLVFFLSGFYYFFFRTIKNPTTKTWLGTGVFLLLSLYSKLNTALVGFCLALYLLFTEKGRDMLKKPGVWLAGALNIIGFLPVIIWNIKLGFPHLVAIRQLTSAPHLSSLERFSKCLKFIGSQFGVLFPLIALGVLWACGAGLKKLKKEKDEKLLALAFLSFPIFAYFFIQSFRSGVFGNWTLVGIFPLLVLFCQQSFSESKSKILSPRYFFVANALSLILCLLLVVEIRYRSLRAYSWKIKEKYHLARPLDWRLDQELEGWKELCQKIERYREKNEELSTRRYQTASIAMFCLPDHPVPVVISAGHKKSQFNLWRSPEELKGKTAIYFDVRPMPEKVKRCFSKLIALDEPMIIFRQNYPIKRFYIYRAIDYHQQ